MQSCSLNGSENDSGFCKSETSEISLLCCAKIPGETSTQRGFVVGTLYELEIRANTMMRFSDIAVSCSSKNVFIAPVYDYSEALLSYGYSFVFCAKEYVEEIKINVSYQKYNFEQIFDVLDNPLASRLIGAKSSPWRAEDEIYLFENYDEYQSFCFNGYAEQSPSVKDIFSEHNLLIVHQSFSSNVISSRYISTFLIDGVLYSQIAANFDSQDDYMDYATELVFYIELPKLTPKLLKKNYVRFFNGGN